MYAILLLNAHRGFIAHLMVQAMDSVSFAYKILIARANTNVIIINVFEFNVPILPIRMIVDSTKNAFSQEVVWRPRRKMRNANN